MRPIAAAFPFVRLLDAANAITAFNIVLSVLTVTFGASGHLSAAAATMCVASALDFLDGHVARTWLADHPSHRAFGRQLDSLADLLNFSVAPALLLWQICGTTAAGAVGGTLVLSGALRLAVFGATSSPASAGYSGLPTTYSGVLFALACQAHAAGRLAPASMLVLVAAIALLQVSALRFPKFKAIPTIASIALCFIAVTVFVHST